MQTVKRAMNRLMLTSGIALLVAIGGSANGAPLNLTDVPLFLNAVVPPLNMLVLGRDHKLFMTAYNDASDLDGDDKLDVGYKGYLPKASGGIDYYGYFDSYKCYTYAAGQFTPVSTTTTKVCTGQWSGDFLNYQTTSRIDALRKVLYGGYRSTDSTTATVLERAYIPQDAHSWGKEYRSVAYDGYDIANYTPYTAPSAGKYILFANTTLSSTLTAATYRNPAGPPLLRVMNGSTHRIWEWVSKESPVAGTDCAAPGSWSNAACDVTPTDYTVRVQVCVSAALKETNCKLYPGGAYKPTGLLHAYGESDQMYFGLLTGTYDNNYEGGAVRKEVTSFTDEVNSSTGQFASPKKGIIASLDAFKIQDYDGNGNYSHNHLCGTPWAQNPANGDCEVWGNPVGEMMFESLRYFAGASAPTAGYQYIGAGSDDLALGLPQITSWKDPYAATPGGQGYPVCAKPFDTVISDVNTSFDSELPGNPWSTVTLPVPTSISSLNVSTMGDQIWNNEFGAVSKSIFIGQVGTAASDGAPTPKTASSFGNIRGLSPEEPTRQGTYYAASVAYYGLVNDINAASKKQNLNTFAVALSSPIPRMEIPVAGKTITLVPLGKVVQSGCCGADFTNWQPTEQIVAFYIDTMKNMPGQTIDNTVNGGLPYVTFRVNFEDAEQGNDYDMDEIVLYTLTVNSDGTLSVQLKTEYASAGHESHIGYVLSGTNSRDGIYLEVLGGGSGNVHYKFDTPGSASAATAKWAGDCIASPASCNLLPPVGTSSYSRKFTPGTNPPATLLEDPLWYASKYGGFDDKNKDGKPQAGEWDSKRAGVPDNYFLVTNALTLELQLSKAFSEILGKVSSASSASVNSGSASSSTRIFQAKFLSVNWTGQLLSYRINPATGDIIYPEVWDASQLLPAPNTRQIITRNTAGTAVPFRWASLDTTRQNLIDTNATLGASKLDYLRGDPTNEGTLATNFRLREDGLGHADRLGDIISSTPLFVGPSPFRISDTMESVAYSTYRNSTSSRQAMVYAGANDGMLHGFNATTGVEVFSYIPSPVFKNLNSLTTQGYSHQYFVDGATKHGDVFYGGAWHTVLVGGLNKGGQGIYALDISNPATTLAAAEANATSVAMWEFTDANDADLGYTYSQPSIVRMQNGKWAAVFGNGYNNTTADGAASTTGEAVLFIVDIQTGALIKKITTGVGASADPTSANRPNGLATPASVDYDGDGIVDYFYAGDLFGNMWKFDVNSNTVANWKVAYTVSGNPAPVYKAKDSATPTPNAQPITEKPVVIRGPGGVGMMVLFGTGKYLESGSIDRSTTPQRTQSFYGIWDKHSMTTSDIVAGRASLTQQSILAELLATFGSNSSNVRVTSDNPTGSTSGWYLDFLSPNTPNYQAERQVSDPLVRDGNVIFTTLIPDSDPCNFGGTSWLFDLDALTGRRQATAPFDNNGDGLFTSADYVTVTVGGTTITVPTSGMGSTGGIMNRPGMVAGKKKDFAYSTQTDGSIVQPDMYQDPGERGRQSWRQIR